MRKIHKTAECSMFYLRNQYLPKMKILPIKKSKNKGIRLKGYDDEFSLQPDTRGNCL